MITPCNGSPCTETGHRHTAKTIQWTGDNIMEITAFMYPDQPVYMGKQFSNADEIVGVVTPQGLKVARLGDWITRGSDGHLRVDENPNAASPITQPTASASAPTQDVPDESSLQHEPEPHVFQYANVSDGLCWCNKAASNVIHTSPESSSPPDAGVVVNETEPYVQRSIYKDGYMWIRLDVSNEAITDAASNMKKLIVERVREMTDLEYSDGDGLRSIDPRALEAIAAQLEGDQP